MGEGGHRSIISSPDLSLVFPSRTAGWMLLSKLLCPNISGFAGIVLDMIGRLYWISARTGTVGFNCREEGFALTCFPSNRWHWKAAWWRAGGGVPRFAGVAEIRVLRREG